METTAPQDTVKNLIPELTQAEMEGVIAYFDVSEKYEEELSKRGFEELKDHPTFGRLIKDTPKEVSDARNKYTRQLQRDAFINGNWRPYIEYQMQLGITYAKMGFDFKSWYEVVGLARNYVIPYFHMEYGHGEEFLKALNGMNVFIDVGMSIMGEAYMHEKKEAIKQANDRLSSIFETAADIIFVLEVEEPGRYQFSSVNKAFHLVTGIPVESVLGKYVEEVIPDFLLGAILEKYKEAIGEKKIVSWDQVMLYPSGENLAEVSVAPLMDENGNCIRLVGTIHDITERNRTERIIKQLNEELEQKVAERTLQLEAANKELEAFTYSVSHDLRSPLRAVNGYAEILREDYGTQLDEEGKRIIDAISSSAAIMGRLIDDLLAFSHLGRKTLKTTKVDMVALTEAVVRELGISIAHNANIRIGALHSVNADFSLLRQVMFNLLSNAIKYSSLIDNPQVEINSEELDDEFVFSVKDNGAGFDMSYVKKLFGVFQRLHSQEEFEGSGVGLAIVHRIILRHGGRVWAEGKVNEGATFYFSLPK